MTVPSLQTAIYSVPSSLRTGTVQPLQAPMPHAITASSEVWWLSNLLDTFSSSALTIPAGPQDVVGMFTRWPDADLTHYVIVPRTMDDFSPAAP